MNQHEKWKINNLNNYFIIKIFNIFICLIINQIDFLNNFFLLKLIFKISLSFINYSNYYNYSKNFFSSLFKSF